MINLGMVKTGLGILASISVGAVVENAVNCTTPATTKGLKKALVWVGGLVIGSMIAEKATNFTEEKFDEVVTNIKSMDETEKVEENKEV